MKSIALTFLFAAFAAFTIQAQGIPQPTHSVTQFSESSTAPLELSDESFQYYNNDGFLYQTKTNLWNGSSWTLDGRAYYTLAADGKPLEILGLSWDVSSSSLINSYRITIAYHTDGQESLRKSEFWDESSSSWQLSGQSANTFTPTNKIQENTQLYYLNNVPEFGSRKLYTYDGSDRVSVLTRQEWNSGAWENQTITDYLYNGAAVDFSQAFERDWIAAQMTWGTPDLKRTQTVTPTQREVLTELLFGATWNPLVKSITIYDANGQILTDQFDTYDASTSAWVTENKLEFTYNNDQSFKQFRYSFMDFDTDELYLAILTDYDYGVYAVSTQTPTLQAKVNVWPNPASDNVQVKLEGNEEAKLTLTDMQGKVISQVNTHAQSANLSLIGNAAGAYLLKIEQGGAYKLVPVVKN